MPLIERYPLLEVYFKHYMSQMVPVGAPYFVAHFDEGPQLFVRIRGRFPLQFGRCVFQMVSESLFFPSSLLDSLLSFAILPLPSLTFVME